MLLNNLRDDQIPRYGLVVPSEVEGEVDGMLKLCQEELEKVESVKPENASWETVIVPLELIDLLTTRVWGPIMHLTRVKDSKELRQAYASCLPKMVQLELRIKQSKPVMTCLKAIKESSAWEELPNAKKRVIETSLRDMMLSGIGLEGELKDRFNAIAEELASLSTSFKENVRDSSNETVLIIRDAKAVEGMPDYVLEAAHANFQSNEHCPEAEKGQGNPEQGPWCFTMDMFFPFMQYCRDRDLREKMYMMYQCRASAGKYDNTPIIERILKLRKEKAQLLGYNSHAEVSMATKMASSPDEVLAMIEKIRLASYEKAKEEVRWMEAVAGHEIRPWDGAFYKERIKEKALNISPDLVNYFPLDHVLNSVYAVIERLFGVSITETEVPDELSWNPAVKLLEVREKGGEEVKARLFVDAVVRPENKKEGAWMSSVVTRHKQEDGSITIPCAHLVTNVPLPVGGKPPLLPQDDVVTIFHELGHCLQHLLTEVDILQVSGTDGIEWDAVELPSQFMENWAYTPDCLKQLGRHWETGSPLPDDIVKNLILMKEFMSGTQMLRQMTFARVDLELHHNYTPDDESVNIFDFEKRISKDFEVIRPVDDVRMLCSFQHIFSGGYSAGYYSYIWADVLQADAFGAFEEAGLDNTEAIDAMGRRFRSTILALGGSEHPMDVFRKFRGRDPSPEALLRHQGLGTNPRTNLMELIESA